MTRKLTFSTLCCPQWDLETILDHASKFGYAGVDFRGIGPTLDVTTLAAFDSDGLATRRMVESRGLTVPCLCSSIKLLEADSRKWNASLEEFMRHLRAAELFGTRIIRIFPGEAPAGVAIDEVLGVARHRLLQLTRMAGRLGARPAVETHDKGWMRASQAIQLVNAFDPIDVPVLWDVRHGIHDGEAWQTSLPIIRERIVSVHVKDARVVEGKELPVLIGEGYLPWKDVIKALDASGYSGWYCLENEKRWHPGAPDPLEILPQFVEWMRSV
jgi:sugar phosphate isomerase/epimerase